MSEVDLVQKHEKCGFECGKKYFANSNYILREIAGENILVSVGVGIADFCGIVNLNVSAKVIWDALQQGATKDELAQELKDRFSISEERASEDIDKTLKLLLERKMACYE